MKKILFMLIVAVIAIFSVIPMHNVFAASVPGFFQVGGKYLTFTGRENTKKGYRVYGYDCSVDLNEQFAERYLNALIKQYNFKIIGHYVNDYRRGQARLWERWVLQYTGSERISTFVHKNIQNRKNPYYCHLVVSRGKDWNSEITHFAIYVSNGLGYGED